LREVGVALGANEEGAKKRIARALEKLQRFFLKRIEESFGWMKTVGGFRKTRFKGIARTQPRAHFVGAACNLVRMATLSLGPPGSAAPR
jgi:hypothetical protein